MDPKKVDLPRFSYSQRRTGAGRVAAWFLTFLVVLIAGACDDHPIPPETAQAVVHGRITTASGEPVDDASVLPRAHFASCDSSGVSQGGTYSRGDGTYEQHAVGPADAKVACVTIEVDLPPIEADQDEADTT